MTATGEQRQPQGRGRRVRFSRSRWLLAPLTTWRARQLAAANPGMDAETAWTTVRLAARPEEVFFARRRPEEPR